jgi:single-strand DNA-binding protein
MNNLNSVLIEGVLVKDPLSQLTEKGNPFCSFTIASSRFYKQDSGIEKEVGFFDVEVWGKLAKSVLKLGHKDRGVRVVGRLKQHNTVGEGGKPVSRIVVVAEHVEFRPENLPMDLGPSLFEEDGSTGSEVSK